MTVPPLRAALALAAAWICGGDAPGQEVEPLELPLLPQHLAVVGLGDDPGGHLVSVHRGVIRLHEEPGATLEIPGSATMWTVHDLDGNGDEDLLLLVDGERLVRLRQEGERLVLSEPLATGLGAVPPRGIHPAAFLQDVDADGDPDLLLPTGDRLQLWLREDDGGFRKGPDLGAVARLGLGTGDDSGDLLQSVERVIELPRLQPEDISGDGRPDLVVHDNLQIHQYVVQGSGFPSEPTRSLDLGQFQDERPDLDLRNLSKAVRWFVVDEWNDLDGDGDQDLVVLSSGKVRVYLGGTDGLQLDTPKQLLKARGNPFYVVTGRVDDDDVPDLVLMRVEDVGIGKLLRAALFSWSIEFDFLVYRGRGDGRFESRPLREKPFRLEGEGLLSEVRTEREELKQIRKRIVRLCDLDGDGRRTDVVILDADGMLRAWRGAVPDRSYLDRVAEEFLREALAEEGELALDVGDLTEWALGRTSALAAVAQQREADASVRLPGTWSPPHAMTTRDLDGDGREEVLALRSFRPEEGPARLVGHVVRFAP